MTSNTGLTGSTEITGVAGDIGATGATGPYYKDARLVFASGVDPKDMLALFGIKKITPIVNV